VQWLKPVIVDTPEAEIGRTVVLGLPRKKVLETPSQPMAGCGDACMSSQLCGEAQIGGLQSRAAQAQSKTLSQKQLM
jgi:hypothetical protein